MIRFLKEHTLIAGTLLLTAAGFLTRVLGFFYRIFLSRAIGAEGLGLYNMVHPVYGICFSLCAGSIQTALSRFIAANARKSKTVFRTALLISFCLSLLLAFLICRFSLPLARYVLLEESCAGLLPFMALSIPFSAVHACINGYYYGMRRTLVPASSQIAEQAIRMGAVFLIADILTEQGAPLTVELAAAGHLIGEIASCLYTAAWFCLFSPSGRLEEERSGIGRSFLASLRSSAAAFRETAAPLMTLALPLMGNRLILNLLGSAEAVWIPDRLSASGLTSQEAFEVYGVLTGMAMPFIFFPSAITNSMAVLLLPDVAQAQADGKRDRIARTISMSMRYSLYMGILCIGVFTWFGPQLGAGVFHNAASGTFMQILAWLCPFLYLSSTAGSILNGLGQTRITFLHNTAALLLRLVFVLAGIPRFGITAYLWGMLASELFLTALHLGALRRRIPFSWDPWNMILKPAALLVISAGLVRFLLGKSAFLPLLSPFFSAAFQIALLTLCYGGLLLLFHRSGHA